MQMHVLKFRLSNGTSASNKDERCTKTKDCGESPCACSGNLKAMQPNGKHSPRL